MTLYDTMLNKTTQSKKDKQYSSDILLETENRMAVARPLRAGIAYGYSFSVLGLKITGKLLSTNVHVHGIETDTWKGFRQQSLCYIQKTVVS